MRIKQGQTRVGRRVGVPDLSVTVEAAQWCLHWTGICGPRCRPLPSCPQLSPEARPDSGDAICKSRGSSRPEWRRQGWGWSRWQGVRRVETWENPRHLGLVGLPSNVALASCGVCPQAPLLRVQEVLNGTEVNLQHLTALVDCRSLHLVRPAPGAGAVTGRGERLGAGVGTQPSLQLAPQGVGDGLGCCELGCSPSVSVSPCCPASSCPHWTQDYVQALTGFCYDGVEGLIYLALFSFVTALMFSSIVCSVPHTWQQKR